MLKLISIYDIDYDSLVQYRKEFSNNWKEVSSVINMSARLKQEYFFLWLKQNRVTNFYLLVDDKNPKYILGDGTFNTLFNYHEEHCNRGNIGYSIRPNERNKHYGTYLLFLLLKKCKEFGLEEVCISCLKSNIGSKKIIESNGGQLEKEFFDICGKDVALKYWIDIEKNDMKHISLR